MIPRTIAAATTSSAATASPPAATAATGLSLFAISAERATPKIRIAKTVVTPMPATNDTRTVSSSSLVSTMVAGIEGPYAGSGSCRSLRANTSPVPAIPRTVMITGPAAPFPNRLLNP